MIFRACIDCFRKIDSHFSKCPACGYIQEGNPEHCLAVGTVLHHQYQIGLGVGGFGITYLGYAAHPGSHQGTVSSRLGESGFPYIAPYTGNKSELYQKGMSMATRYSFLHPHLNSYN